MQVRFAPPYLQALDREKAGTLVVSAFADERPLRGLAGRIDWRLCGQLSHLLATEKVDANFGTALLCPTAGRLPFSRLLFIGLGDRANYGQELYAEACHVMAWKLARMSEDSYAMALPGHIGRGLGLREAVWGWRHGIIRSFDSEALRKLDVCILAEPEVAVELRTPMLAVAQEVNEALVREQQQLMAQHNPMPVEAATPAGPSMPQMNGRRGWQSGVMKIGPGTASQAPASPPNRDSNH